jgi:predicted patatin/cPLA2 family phospholipase
MGNKGLIKNKVDRYMRHIEALEVGYEKMLDILNKNMDKSEDEEGNETISLKDSQVKQFADGILKASETANSILLQIDEKEESLEKLRSPEKHSLKKAKSEEKESSALNSRLK